MKNDTNIPTETQESWLATLFGRIPLQTLESLCQRLSLGLRSGVDILKLFEQESLRGTGKHRQAMQLIRQRLAQGESLAQAFQAASPYFPPLLVQMIAAGETSGGLDRILHHMSQHYHELRTARRDFLGQISWPVIQLVIALAVVCLVIGILGIITTNDLESNFDPLGFGLSGVSGIAFFLSIVAVVLCFFGLLGIGLWKNALDCHRWLIPFLLKIPVIGGVLSNLAMARMSMTLSMLLNAGVDAVKSVRESFLSTGNYFYIQGTSVAVEKVRSGRTFAESFAAANVLPSDFIDAIDIGETSGNETESLERLSVEYARRAKSSLAQLSVISGVAIWIFIAAFIIFIIIRMAMQYVNMLNSLMS
jgi:type IV pilus assembly protein PilC